MKNKSCTLIMVVFAMIFCFMSPVNAYAEDQTEREQKYETTFTNFVRSDVNNDGNVNYTDILIAKKLVLSGRANVIYLCEVKRNVVSAKEYLPKVTRIELKDLEVTLENITYLREILETYDTVELKNEMLYIKKYSIVYAIDLRGCIINKEVLSDADNLDINFFKIWDFDSVETTNPYRNITFYYGGIVTETMEFKVIID